MVSTSAFALVTAFASILIARADVVPSEPSPGGVYRPGQTCPIAWDADTAVPSDWKNMNIQLMTGDNFNMVHITTVATNQDGTVSGRFEYPCPAVNPPSAIYFYQFTSPTADNKTWTTRFTITSATGATSPPANPTQPGSNEPIPWGVGALADPSKAVPPPASAGGPASIPPSNVTTPASSSIPVSSTIATSSSAPAVLATTSRAVVTSVVRASTADATPTGQLNASSGAVGMFTSYSPINCAVSLALSALGFALFL